MDDRFQNDILDEWEEDDDSRRRASMGRRGSGSGGPTQPFCQVEDCTTDMTRSKTYHRRHKVCEVHAKAPVVLIVGRQQRFCQQCSSAGFMTYRNLMTRKGVVVDVWPDITNEGVKPPTNHMEKLLDDNKNKYLQTTKSRFLENPLYGVTYHQLMIK